MTDRQNSCAFHGNCNWLRVTLLACGLLSVATARLSVPNHVAEEKADVGRVLQNSGPSDPTMVPLYFGVGQGTTGTHTMFDATCRLNLTSVHGDMACIDNTTTAERQEMAIAGVDAHARSNLAYLKIRDCAIPGRNPKCTFAETVDLVNQMKEEGRNVIKSGVDALHDTPYTFMAQYVHQVAKTERGVDPILLISERDPQNWAQRRAEAHPLVVVCRDSLGFIEENTPRGPFYDPFDLDQCLQRAVARQAELNLPPLTILNDVFVSYRSLLLEAKGNPDLVETVHRRSQEGLEYYQNELFETTYNVTFSVNLFDTAEPIDEVALAQNIEAAVIQDKSPEFVDLVRSNGFRFRAKPIQTVHVNMTSAVQAAA